MSELCRICPTTSDHETWVVGARNQRLALTARIDKREFVRRLRRQADERRYNFRGGSKGAAASTAAPP
jgi:hypothetical protein